MKMSWEILEHDRSNYLTRSRTPWGWLVMSTDDALTSQYTVYSTPENMTGYQWRTSITFVFDPFHCWKNKKHNNR